MTSDATLLSDPVFQLNTLLWALEELPEGLHIRPVLRASGYYLNAIGRRVLTPADPTSREALASMTAKDLSPCRPDLWLKHQEHGVDPIIELKAHGFSSASSNTVQALKLLASAADLGPSIGSRDTLLGHVIYVTTHVDASDMRDTLEELRAKLEAVGGPVAPHGVVGLVSLEDGIALMSPAPNDLPDPARIALQEPAVVLERSNPGDEIVPLYFIPWLPGTDATQDPELRSDGLRELTARLLTQAIAAVGQARVPTVVTLTGTALLDAATFGIFARWQDADRKQFSESAAKIIERALRTTGMARRTHELVEIDLPTEDDHGRVLERLERADPADPSSNLEGVVDEPPTLFDDLPDEAKRDIEGS